MRGSYCGVTIGNGWMREDPELIYPEKHEQMSDIELHDALSNHHLHATKRLTTTELSEIIQSSLKEVSDEHRLGMCFVDYCDIVCELVADKLEPYDTTVVLVNGTYRHQFKNSEPDEYGHWWIHLPELELILDPTRSQFDCDDLVVDTRDPENTANYIFPPE